MGVVRRYTYTSWHTQGEGKKQFISREKASRCCWALGQEKMRLCRGPDHRQEHMQVPIFCKDNCDCSKGRKINTSGYCPEEELFAYKLFGHPRISIGQIFSMHTPLHIFFEIKSTNIQWLFSVKVSFFPLLPVLSLKLSITRSRPCSLGFPGVFSLTSSFFSYAKRNFSHSLLAHEVVHSCIF